MELVLIAALAVVILVGAGLVVTRRKGETYEAAPPAMPGDAPPAPAEITETLDEPLVEEAAPPVTEPAPPVVEEAPVKPRFRDRLGKARGAVSGYLGSVLAATRSSPRPGTTSRRR